MGFNFDEEEFQKGEKDYKNKLLVSCAQNENFKAIFKEFYYES